MKKQILSMILTLTMLFSVMPTMVLAAEKPSIPIAPVSSNTTNPYTLSSVTSDSVIAMKSGAVPDIVSINANVNNVQNYISLNWTNTSPDISDYHYMVTKKDVDAGGTAQTIPLKSSIKVLNIYPGDRSGATSQPGYAQSGYPTDASAGVKKWMEQDGFGKGNISVTSVYIGSFNNSPGTYLKKDAKTGLYNYDVIFVGCWDSNNNADLTLAGKDLIQEFINSGGGYLAGHDTAMPGTYSMTNLSSLTQANLNMQLDSRVPHYGSYGSYGSTGYVDIAIAKKGSLINYPWSLSGSTLSVPASHSTNQFAMGDVWMRYSSNPLGTSQITTLNGRAGTNNFYLTTWNNCAMIQTGHSNGAATDDEKKILANTLMYLAQISTDKSFEDHTAQDVTNPDSVAALVSVGNDNRANLTYLAPADAGNTYEYQLKAIDKTGTVTNSSTISATITSGIKGYSIAIDKNPNTVPDDSIDTTELSYTTEQLEAGSWYAHIKAIDNAGNASSTTNVNFNVSSEYTITYDGNGSDGGTVPRDSALYKKDASAIIMSNGNLTKSRYIFNGWNTASDGSGTSYRATDTIIIKGNVTLYAQWKVIDSAQTPVFTQNNVSGVETVTKGAIAITLSVTVDEVTDGGNITYQWYKCTTNSTGGGIAIGGATDPSYTPPTDVAGTSYYYVVVTNTVAGVPASSNTSSMKEVIVLDNPPVVYNVSTSSTSLTNITLSNPSATQYQNYTTTISADSGYTLPNSITVTMGGKTLVSGVEYIYEKTSSTVGAVTVYNVTGELAITAAGALIPAQIYTISFNSNGATTYISGPCGTAIVLPTPSPANEGDIFDGWYRDLGFTILYNSDTIGNEDINLYAKWIQKTYTITGNVKEEETNNNVSGATVKLMAGNRQVAYTTTNLSGNFTIRSVPAGTYNLAITKGDQTITLMITVLDSNIAIGSVTLPKAKKNSVVEVRQNTPDIVVDKLNDFFNSDKFTQDDRNVVDAGGMVEIKLLVEKKNESGDNAAANANSIKTLAEGSGKTIGIFLDLTVSKIITLAGGTAEQPILIDQLSDLISIDIPLPVELQGKSGYVIYRYHGAMVQTITEVVNDGEYIEVSPGGKSIKLHTKKFSTYAIGYTAPSTPPTNNPSSSSGGAVSSTITTEPSEGGKIDISTDNTTATIIHDDGYAIADVIIDGKSIGATKKYTFTDNKTHKIRAVFVKKSALPYYNKDGEKVFIGFSAIEENLYKYIAPANVTVEFTENPKNFIDNTIAWAKPSIDFVTEREIFSGTEQNIFSPNEGMTRAMFVTVIGKLYERSFGSVSGTSTFSDVDANAYYAKYVAWANDYGIIKGIGVNRFAPNAKVTREQMAVIMFNLATLLKKTAVADTSLTYADSTSISSWAIDGAKYCHRTKIIEGRTGGNFAPQESATRAEASAVLQKFIVNMLK